MKLKTYNPEELPSARLTTPVIGLSSKSGTFRFNPTAVEKLGLKANNQIMIHQDEENPADWYLEIVKEKGFLARKKKTTGEFGLLIQSCPLVRKIFDSVDCKKISGSILIGSEPIKFEKRTLWPLITAKLVN